MKTIITSLLLSLALSTFGQVVIPSCDTIDLPNIADQEKKSRVANGQYKKCIENNLIQIGTYKDGVLDGPFIEYFQNKCSDEECHHSQGSHIFKEIGDYLNGQKDGEWNTTGNFEKIISNYKDGKLNGEYTVYSAEVARKFDADWIINIHSRESISLQGYYLNGLKSGRWFYDEGEIQKIAHYKKGILNGEYHTYMCCDSSDQIEKGVYKNGKKEGAWIEETYMFDEENYDREKSLPVYKEGEIISYRDPGRTARDVEESQKLVFKLLIFTVTLIILIVVGTRIGWKRILRLITNFLNRSKRILDMAINSKTSPVISLVLNIFCWILLFFMRSSPGPMAGIEKVFFGILLFIPLTLSIISVSIKNENGRITLATLAIIGALLFLIPNLFFNY